MAIIRKITIGSTTHFKNSLDFCGRFSIGIILGLGIGYGIVTMMDLAFILNNQIIMISFFFSTLIGVVFGYFPARKAARLNPIDALRYE